MKKFMLASVAVVSMFNMACRGSETKTSTPSTPSTAPVVTTPDVVVVPTQKAEDVSTTTVEKTPLEPTVEPTVTEETPVVAPVVPPTVPPTVTGDVVQPPTKVEGTTTTQLPTEVQKTPAVTPVPATTSK